ncbi:MAG: undecaprenyldiphospho-muramoylpentapeptide beta-N-acetylglucosaminyltransferase [bacterium]
MRWLIAAGGTGGHVFPALSLAQAVQESDPGDQVLFVGTSRGLEARVVPAHGFTLRSIPARALMGLAWKEKVKTFLGLPWVFGHCMGILAGFRPHLVVGMGGYVAGPVVLLASLTGIPTAVAEQNAFAGRTNRILGRIVKKVFLAFEETRSQFPPGKTSVTGNPVRRELEDAATQCASLQWEASRKEEFHLLVFGGSQGARAIDLAVQEALPLLARLPFPLRVLHQAGEAQLKQLDLAYQESGIAHEVVRFIDHMDSAYSWAHLVICRAGASSLAELALFGRPSILVPFPYAVDDHQKRNAMLFQKAGASVMLEQKDLSGASLAAMVEALATEPQRLQGMAVAARSLAKPQAAQAMARECRAMVEARR